MNFVKSDLEVIRFVCFEFEHFSVDQMEILLRVISNYFQTDTAIFSKGKNCIVKNGDSFIERELINQGVRIYDELLPTLKIEIHISGKPIKKAILYVKAPKDLCNVTDKHIKQCVIRITKKISADINFLLSAIDNVEIRENFFIQDIAIWDGDFGGQYDWGSIYIDFGNFIPNRKNYKVARCWIKYAQYKINLINHPTFSFIEITSKIYLTLLQCFLRFIIHEPTDNLPYIPSFFEGKSILVDRTDLSNEYIKDFVNNRMVPNDIASLFLKFEKLSEAEKNVFFNSVNVYCEGMKHDGAVALSYYIISIETLSAYDAKEKNINNQNKVDMIWGFLNKLFSNSQVGHEIIEQMYSVRSAYVHNGIANNNFLDEIFIKSVIDNSHCKIIERIANFALILWLKAR